MNGERGAGFLAMDGGSPCGIVGSFLDQNYPTRAWIVSMHHFPELQGLDKPIVWVFPELTVCLKCGFSEFVVPEREH